MHLLPVPHDMGQAKSTSDYIYVCVTYTALVLWFRQHSELIVVCASLDDVTVIDCLRPLDDVTVVYASLDDVTVNGRLRLS